MSGENNKTTQMENSNGCAELNRRFPLLHSSAIKAWEQILIRPRIRKKPLARDVFTF